MTYWKCRAHRGYRPNSTCMWAGVWWHSTGFPGHHTLISAACALGHMAERQYGFRWNKSCRSAGLRKGAHPGWSGWWLSSKGSAFKAGDTGWMPGLGRFPWRRKWQPTPVFLPGKSHGQRNQVGLYHSVLLPKSWSLEVPHPRFNRKDRFPRSSWDSENPAAEPGYSAPVYRGAGELCQTWHPTRTERDLQPGASMRLLPVGSKSLPKNRACNASCMIQDLLYWYQSKQIWVPATPQATLES